MLKALLLSLSLLVVVFLQAQQTAIDWTRVECGTTNEHHLFAELDSGYVIVMDFVMMNCQGCVTASNGINAILAEYAISHPGKIRFYSVGFNNSTVCSQLLDWKLAHGYKHPVFEKGTAEVTYYGGMGMPTIVVLGGTTQHKVYYNNFGYNSSEDPIIRSAIDLALMESSPTATEDPLAEDSFEVFPNPFGNELTIQSKGLYNITHAIIRDLSGREYKRIDNSGLNTNLTIGTSDLSAGIWFIGLYDSDRLILLKKVVKK